MKGLNGLVYSGVDGNGTSFIYDANGNLLSKNNTYKSEEYFYNGRRMARKTTSSVPRMAHKCQTSFGLASYLRSQNSVSSFIKDDEITTDAFGRRNLVQDVGSTTMRTLYDGLSFDILREAEVFQGGDFTTNFVQSGSINYATNQVSSSRYRYIESDNNSDNRYKNDEGYIQTQNRFTGTRTPLYGKGEAVATNRSASQHNNGRAYFGTDILGSVRSVTNEYSTLEDRYEYDIFGTPYEGDFSAGLSNGYTNKPNDTVTGLYNYGYRDYSPQVARFTTVDPIRDGNNWFSYVVNDPVNYVDLWGLSASDAQEKKDFQWPLENNIITSEFGYREDAVPNNHQGIDLSAEVGTPVYAVSEGELTLADLEYKHSASNSSYLIIDGTNGYEQRYVHMDSFTVEVGDKVNKGELIGYSGDKKDTPPHLHFELRKDGKPVDPELYLP